MRYQLMAIYRGMAFEADVGPTDEDVVLFAAGPPPEELQFEPAAGHWRRQVSRGELDALWESRPTGRYRGQGCLVLDDLGDRLHIAFQGHDAYQAEQLGYWQVDRGVYEVVVPRQDVTDLGEIRHDHPVRRPEPAPPTGPPGPMTIPPGPGTPPPGLITTPPGPVPAQAPGLMPAQGPGPMAAQSGPMAAQGPGATATPPGPMPAQNPGPAAGQGAIPPAPMQRAPEPTQPAPEPMPTAPGPMPAPPAPMPAPPWPAPAGAPESSMTTQPQQPMPPEQAGPMEQAGQQAPTAGQQGPATGGPQQQPSVPGPAAPAADQAAPVPPPAPSGVSSSLPADMMAPTPPSEPRPNGTTRWNAFLPGHSPPGSAAPAGTNGTNGWNGAAHSAPAVASGTAAPAADPGAATAPGGRTAARPERADTHSVFKDLVGLAAIPDGSYAIDEDVDGALCLVRTDDGFEVYSSADNAKHEVRFFDDEESAYFYLFGVLAAEALRSGRLVRRPG